MRKWGALLALAVALSLSLVFAAQAFAAVTIKVADPSAAYLAETTKIDISALTPLSMVTSVTDGNVTVTFDGEMRVVTAGSEAWGNAGEVEEIAPAAMLQAIAGVTTRTMQLDRPVHEFGFEAAGWDFGTTTVVATFDVISDGEVLATITRAISSPPGNFNARLFAIKSDVPFDRVVVTIDTPMGFSVAQLRYSETAPSAVSGTVKSAATGVPVPFARLYIEHGGLVVTELEANAQGKYSVVLPSGDYLFHVSGPGWGDISEAVAVPDAALTQDFELTVRYDQAVYRFFNMKAGVHFYTANDAEFLNTLNNLGDAFKYDGIAYSVAVADTEGMVPLYRFFNPKRGVHFYTASEAEKNGVIQDHSDIYVYEGVAYLVSTQGNGTPVYRYYLPSRNTHFYTADTAEINLNSKLSNTYQYEGIGYYVGIGDRKR